MAEQTQSPLARWYCQGDFAGTALHPDTTFDIAQGGCGPCALAHALISQGAVGATPTKMVDALNAEFPAHDWFTNTGGTGDGYLGPTACRFGCRMRTLWPAKDGGKAEGDPAEGQAHATEAPSATAAEKVFDGVLSAIEQGHAVIVSSHGDVFHGPDGRPYSSMGHYVCFYAFDERGDMLAADSVEFVDEKGPLGGPSNPYTIEQARKLFDVAVAHPERHEVIEVWRP